MEEDFIKISNLKIFAHHGVFEEETRDGQDFYVNAKLFLDTREAGKTDLLEKSVHYGEACMLITEYLQENTFKLLEAAAEHVVWEVFRVYPLVKGVEFEICKPQAPIPLPFENVSVTVFRRWHEVYLAFGSNMGEKEGYIEEGIQKLREHGLCRVKRVSSYFVTKPYGGVEQDDFVNGALCLETLLMPMELLVLLHGIEEDAGRERKVHWGPRTLDLDILFYDKEVIDSEELVIPHADMQNRDFVLKPMAEIAPFFRHPLNHKTIEQMLKELDY